MSVSESLSLSVSTSTLHSQLNGIYESELNSLSLSESLSMSQSLSQSLSDSQSTSATQSMHDRISKGQLPQTGESESKASILALGLGALGLAFKNRKKNEPED